MTNYPVTAHTIPFNPLAIARALAALLDRPETLNLAFCTQRHITVNERSCSCTDPKYLVVLSATRERLSIADIESKLTVKYMR